MRLRIFGIDVSVSFWFFATIAGVLLAGKETLALYMLAPIAIHELGHLVAMRLCGIRVEAVAFRAFSIDIRRSASATAGYGTDILLALGGVAANFFAALCLYLFAFQSMRVMLLGAANVAVALFNALPIGNLDGGQALRLLLERFGSVEKAFAISRICSFLVLVPLFGAAAFYVLQGVVNPSLLLVCVYLAGVVIFADT